MESYYKRAIAYTSAVIGLSSLIIFIRSNAVQSWSHHNAALSDRSAKQYRAFISEWRNSEYAERITGLLRERVDIDYKALNLLLPEEVDAFIRDYPEMHPRKVRKDQYEAVVADGAYKVLADYYSSEGVDAVRRLDVEKRIDRLVDKEINEAVKLGDYKSLSQLARKYSGWKSSESRIKLLYDNVKLAVAKERWDSLKESKDDTALNKFAKEFAGTQFAKLADKRVESLCDDYEYVKEKNNLWLYHDFLKRNPKSCYADDANRIIVNTLEGMVFGRIKIHDKSAIRDLLSEYEQTRPYSGTVVGAIGSSPFEIKTPSGSDDYFIKLVNSYNGNQIGIFVRGGSTYEAYVPPGTYTLRYACGKKWYGSRLLFGLDASYSKSNQTFSFERGSGYTLSLTRVLHGNFSTNTMDAKDF